MDKERVLEELFTCKRRLNDMLEVLERKIEHIATWSEIDKTSLTFENDIMKVKRTLEDAEQVVRKLA